VELTNYIQHAMQHPIPDRRFDLWEMTQEGQIVGYYWKSVESAWKDSIVPGWWYCVSYGNYDEAFYHESDLRLMEVDTNG